MLVTPIQNDPSEAGAAAGPAPEVTQPEGGLPGTGEEVVASGPGGAAESSVSVIDVIRETGNPGYTPDHPQTEVVPSSVPASSGIIDWS